MYIAGQYSSESSCTGSPQKCFVISSFFVYSKIALVFSDCGWGLMLTPCVFDNWYTVKRREYKPCFLYSSNFLVMNVGCNLLWTNQVRCSADESCALLHSLETYIILIVQILRLPCCIIYPTWLVRLAVPHAFVSSN